MTKPNINDTGSAPTDANSVVCEGLVVAIDGGVVKVSMEANEACSSCSAKSSCSMAPAGGQLVEFKAEGFRVGERVHISTDTRRLLLVSTTLYLVPTLLIIAGSFGGFILLPTRLGVSPDMGGFIGVVAGILLGLAYIHFFKVLTGAEDTLLHLEKIEDPDA